ncbi:acetylserotonin O-methyltransferase [Rhodobacter sp. KR11]|uniref:acetylserotonin O-methyltransferase n=1 Tax=Rhodobacter sp. KR11 TaxID=2974588 RepID=UPI002223A552|nr:acetylserotonin O-methyltransferase [Rhodobacter sp. KR11]MCW1920212.1 acetylserotonin O-methyltransferase [Rhodobacter sp. KR11]
MDGGHPVAPRPQSPWVRLALSQRFHKLAARIPLLRRFARAEGDALFDLVQGFVKSQVLMALVDLGVLESLSQTPLDTAELCHLTRVPPQRLAVLLQAATALRLVTQRRALWHLTPRGAAFVTVPGLVQMVSHHRALYADLAEPGTFFRDAPATRLAAFWPYVFGAGLADPDAQRYSRLMAESQALVAADTLAQVDLSRASRLMDIGGGHGAFLDAVAQAHPGLGLMLFDLPQVVAGAPATLQASRHPGSFRTDPLPLGADAISLIRVLYDHSDATVRALLAKVHDALPPGGLLVISEPMSGGARPDPATDVYFAVYTMAMQTGRTRSAAEISALLTEAGFTAIATPRPARPFVTGVITARRTQASL